MIPADLPLRVEVEIVTADPFTPMPVTDDRTGAIMRCIRAHESDTAGGYRAENPDSTASGAYQFTDGTWRSVSREAGIRVPSHASDASPALQDAVARYALTHGHAKAWDGTHCPTTTIAR